MCKFWALVVVDLSFLRVDSLPHRKILNWCHNIYFYGDGSYKRQFLGGLCKPCYVKDAWSERTCFRRDRLGRQSEKIMYLHHRRRGTLTARYSRHRQVFLWLVEFHSWPWEVHTSKLSLDFCLASESGQCKIKIRDQDTGQTLKFQKSYRTF